MAKATKILGGGDSFFFFFACICVDIMIGVQKGRSQPEKYFVIMEGVVSSLLEACINKKEIAKL
jgi:hypothetical protein